LNYIWIIRHGKSAEGEIGQSDHDRVLNKRGKRDGTNMRNWFAQQDHPAQWLWSSSAVRAKLTSAYVAAGFNTTLVEQPVLYLASQQSVLSCLQSTPGDVTSVALVAHNPGLTHFVNKLGANPITQNLVTFGTALFATTQSWPELTFGSAELISLQSPKTIFGD